jgi:hypothetical protein
MKLEGNGIAIKKLSSMFCALCDLLEKRIIYLFSPCDNFTHVCLKYSRAMVFKHGDFIKETYDNV